MSSRPRIRLAFLVFLTALSTTTPASGDDGVYKPDETCDRMFVHKGTVSSIDTGRGMNGEGLRPILKANRDAEKFLDEYQANRRTKVWLAYTGTLGVATILGGIFASPSMGDTQVQRKNVRYAFIGTGVLIIAGGYIWSQLKMHANESNLTEAVSTYNRGVPQEHRIKLGIDVSPDGKQGLLKTEVNL